jgi:hypothetical protein
LSIESGLELATNADRTEIIYGTPKIIKRTLERFSATREKIDVCISSSTPEATVKAEPIFKEVLQLKKNRYRDQIYHGCNSTKSHLLQRLDVDRRITSYGWN